MNADMEQRVIDGDYYTLHRLATMAALSRGRMLDVGFARVPNLHLSGDVIGVDLECAPRPRNYRATVVNDVNHLCFADATFDTVIAGEIIEHLEQPVLFLRNCRRLLKPSGRLVLTTPNPYYPPIILLNWLMIRRYFYSADHVFEIAPRYMIRLLENTGYKRPKMISGGMPFPLGKWRSLYIPSHRAVCYHAIYVAEAGP
jgi:SAM-dependent methyltransferase